MVTPQESSEHPTTVTVLGAGTMGSAMVRRLAGAGLSPRVWNRSSSRLVDLAGVAQTFTDASESVRGSEVVITSLSTADVVEGVVLGGGVAEAMDAGATLAQMGTIGLDGTRSLAFALAELRPDIHFVDAPVSGSRGPAEAGQLVILASGPTAAQAVLAPVFSALARRTLWLGPAGTGSRVKLILNTWLAFEVEAAAEALALASAWDVSASTLGDALEGSVLVSPYAASKLAKMLEQNDDADFALEMAHKDLGLVVEAGGGRNAPLAEAIAKRWAGLIDQGWGPSDVSAARHGLAPADPDHIGDGSSA